jgi:hypothetical protein
MRRSAAITTGVGDDARIIAFALPGVTSYMSIQHEVAP